MFYHPNLFRIFVPYKLKLLGHEIKICDFYSFDGYPH